MTSPIGEVAHGVNHGAHGVNHERPGLTRLVLGYGQVRVGWSPPRSLRMRAVELLPVVRRLTGAKFNCLSHLCH